MRAGDVGPEVAGRLGHRLADQRQGGEMQHAVEAVADHLGQRRSVEDVDLHEGRLRRHGPVVTLGEVVGHGHGVPGVDQLGRHHAADVAGPTHHEKFHAGTSSIRRSS